MLNMIPNYIVKLLTLFSLVTPNTIRIAVIDTGIDLNNLSGIKFCEQTVYDFTEEGISDSTSYKHGTHIAHIIADGLKDEDYCITIMKVYRKYSVDKDMIDNSIKAYRVVLLGKYDVINYSAGGFSEQPIKREFEAIKLLTQHNIKFVVASGNDGVNLNKGCFFYPACYNLPIYVTGSVDNNNKISYYSNYGKVVKYWENGNNVRAGGITLTGTSQATALETVQIVKDLITFRRNNE